ncbi:MAG: class I SAM-dependent methyltransferase [Gemmatimonadota bacterium]
MSGSLPDMGDWDAVFDETYLRSYVPFLDEERTREEALGAVGLAGVEPGADVLDCPVGFGRHALVLAEAGYSVTGLDRSEVQLAEAERRRGDAEWPKLVRGDYRELPFADESFDAVLNLFTSLGYLDRAGDVAVLREFTRVLRPRGALVVETMHRDRLTRMFLPRTWDRLEDGTLLLQEREPDWFAGTVSTLHLMVTPDGERIERRFVFRPYAATELAGMLDEAGFAEIEGFSDWSGEGAPEPDKRLIVRARRPG